MLRPDMEKYLHIIFKILIYTAIALIAFFALKLMFIYFMPFIIALMLSIIIEPIIVFLQKFKLNRASR